MSKHAGAWFLFIFALVTAAPLARAQVEEKRFIEEERRRRMEPSGQAGDDLRQPFLWDAGGWVHSEFVQLDDAPYRDTRTLRFYDLRLWGEARIERRYTAYLRLLSQYTDFNAGDQFEGEDDDEYKILEIDQAYAEADLSSDREKATVRAGKQFFSLGRGLLYNAVALGGTASYASGRFSARGFGAHSVIHEYDIDQSRHDYDESRRVFAGLEVDYLVTGSHHAYVMALFEKDLNEEEDDSATQDWEYDANYVGAGARGDAGWGLGYAIEGVFEFGTAPAAGSTEKEDIRAWAATASVDYRLDSPLSPFLAAEYMYGSGDSDRGSVTDVASGNAAGTEDRGFLPFGFVQTGFSLFPRLSNIHIFRLGGSLRPLASVDACRELEIGAYGYVYRKDRESAPISDPRSYLEDADLGKEVDAILRWRVLSDLGFSFSYGRFFPGGAYDEKQKRDFISAGITYSF